MIKKIIVSTVLFVLSITSGKANDPNVLVTTSLYSGNYFKALTLYNQYENELTEMNKWMAQALLYSYFNKPTEGNVAINLLLEKYGIKLGTASYFALSTLLADNYAILQNYPQAEQALRNVTDKNLSTISPAIIAELQDQIAQYAALSDYAPLQVEMPEQDCTIRLTTIDSTSINVPVTVNGTEQVFIFDTGAAKCAISEQTAKAVNAQIICDSVVVSGFGGQALGKLALIKELKLGDIRITNIPFVVIPEEGNTAEHVNGVIGLSVISRLHEVQFALQDKKLIIPHKASNYPYTNNFFIKKGSLFVSCQNDSNPLIMFFDTGFNNFFLNENYFANNQAQVMQAGKKMLLETSGVAGEVSDIAYELPSFTITIGNGSLTLQAVNVLTQQDDLSISPNDGSIGLSAINQYKKVCVNFDSNSINVYP